MSLIVQKFGGSSVRDAQRIMNVAGIIADTYRAGNQLLVVLSAQGDTTDDLIEKAKEINPKASKREMDMLLSTGEQISIALCAMALEGMGLPVVSLAAWQVGIHTSSAYSDARIKKIDQERIRQELDKNKIVLVAGIFLFLLLCLLQFVVQDGQCFLHLVAALARLFLQLLTAGEEGGTCLLSLVLLFLGLG